MLRFSTSLPCRYSHFHQRPFALLALNRQAPFQQPGTLLHAGQTKAPLSARGLHLLEVKTFAVVPDAKANSFSIESQTHFYLGGFGMPPYVGEGLLADAKECSLDVGGQLPPVSGKAEGSLLPALGGEPPDLSL